MMMMMKSDLILFGILIVRQFLLCSFSFDIIQYIFNFIPCRRRLSFVKGIRSAVSSWFLVFRMNLL